MAISSNTGNILDALLGPGPRTEMVAAMNGILAGVTPGTALAGYAVVLDDSKGIATITSATITTLTSTTVASAAITGTTTLTMTSANAAALAVGLNGATNPAFVVDSSTGSQAAGLKVTGATSAGNVAIAVISSAGAANLLIDAKSTGTIGIGTVSSGAVTIAPATTITGALTPTGGVVAAGGFSATPCGMINTNGEPAVAATDGTELTPTTTSVYVAEIFIPCNMTITGVRHFNGSDVTGNVSVALYTSAGAAIAAAVSAATAGSGTDAYQAIPFAAPYAAKGPAKYLVGFQYSSASARPNCHLIGNVFAIAQASATIGVTAISPLPTAFVATTCPIASLY